MAFFFIDLTNGNDAYDGTQTWVHAALAGCIWTSDGTAVGATCLLTDPTGPFAPADIGKIIHVTSGANGAWMLVTGLNITGEIVTGYIYGQASTLDEDGVVDAATGTGPVKSYARLTALAGESDICYRCESIGLRRINREGTSDSIDPVTGENTKKVFPQGVQVSPGVDPFTVLSLTEQQYRQRQAIEAENERHNEQERAKASRDRRFRMP